MHFEKPATLAVQGRPQQSHDETGCQMTGDKFRARADGYIKNARVVTDPEHKLAHAGVAERSSRPDPNKVSPLNSLAWFDASTLARGYKGTCREKRVDLAAVEECTLV